MIPTFSTPSSLLLLIVASNLERRKYIIEKMVLPLFLNTRYIIVFDAIYRSNLFYILQLIVKKNVIKWNLV